MTEPRFLSVEDVIEIHADQIERYGGSDLPPFITPRPTKLTPVPDGLRFDGCG